MDMTIDSKWYRSYVGWYDLYAATGIHVFRTLLDLGLKPEHTFLDVGCGPLNIGKYVIAYLEKNKYVGIEPTVPMIQAAHEHEVGYDFLTVKGAQLYSFSNFKLTDATCPSGHGYDFILAHSMFTHATKSQVRTIMREAFMALALGGTFAATYYAGLGDNELTEWEYPGGVSYTDEFIKEVAWDAGFFHKVLGDTKHPAGHTWAIMTK